MIDIIIIIIINKSKNIKIVIVMNKALYIKKKTQYGPPMVYFGVSIVHEQYIFLIIYNCYLNVMREG